MFHQYSGRLCDMSNLMKLGLGKESRDEFKRNESRSGLICTASKCEGVIFVAIR